MFKNIINDLKQYDAQKIQSPATINFISSKHDNDEELVMHSKSDNIEIMISNVTDELQKNYLIHLRTYIERIYNG